MHPILLAPLLLAQTVVTPGEALTFKDAVVVKAYPAQFGCGIFKVWGAMEFAHDGVIDRVYFMCAMEEDMPRDGARCTMTMHKDLIDEITFDGTQSGFRGYVGDTITCDPPVGLVHKEFRDATILSYGPMPVENAPSSATARAVRIRTSSGETAELHFVHYYQNKGIGFVDLLRGFPAYPAIGSKCDFETSASRRVRASIREATPEELIYSMACKP